MLLSALVPGLGQVLQRRFGAALMQFGTAAIYVAGTLALQPRAVGAIVAWTIWSMLDAYRYNAD